MAIKWKGRLNGKSGMGENVEKRRRALKVSDGERKSCQEKKKERVGKTSERKLSRNELQTEGGVQREDPGD